MKYNGNHICVRKKGNKYYVGLSEIYVSEFDEIEVVTSPPLGETCDGEDLCCVDTYSSSYEFHIPFFGEIIEVNNELSSLPSLIKDEEEGWICLMKDIDKDVYDDMMTYDQYHEYLELEGLV